jgi:CelD/BcsL family acetyltransferase involved in cellulose biosynthesis
MVIRTDSSALLDLSGPWDDLVPVEARLGPFPTSAWCRLWWSHLGAVDGNELRVATVVEGEELVAVVPLYLETARRRLLFFGGRDVTDYTGPTAMSEHLIAAAAAALEAAEAEQAVLECLSTPDDLGFADALVSEADRLGAPAKRFASEPAPFLDLPAEVGAFYEGLGGKERHELRRKLRRFEREAGEPRLRRADAGHLEQDLELFFRWHRAAPGAKALFMSPPREAFFRAVAADFLRREWLAFDILQGGNTPIAAAFSFVVGDTIYLYNSAFEPEAQRWSPGMVLLALLIERAIRDGLRRLDFLKGGERYKYQLGGIPRALSTVSVGGQVAEQRAP